MLELSTVNDSPYKLLVLDLDGTTLHGHGKLGQRDIDAALALKEAGVQVTINTGRLFTGTQWVAERLGVEGSVSVVNGAELIDAHTGVATYGDYLDRDARLHTRALMSELGLTAFVFASRDIHYGRADERHAQYLGIWTPDLVAHDDIHAAPAWEQDDIVAVCAVGDNARIDTLRERFHAELPRELGTFRFQTFDNEGFLKMRHHGQDKGSALVRMAEERGFTAAETVAVGDWLNDLPMFGTAGRSYAMGHALDEVKSAADDVLTADRNTGGGIAEVAKKVWGIEV